MLPVPGELFEGKYKIEEVLGEGGFARVYRATDTTIGRNVAIKLLHGRAQGRATEARFLREIRVVASLDSPSILKVFDSGRTDDGALFMVCEYLPGTDLTSLMARGRLPERQAMHILRQVLQALSAAHNAGVLHRDVKPDNVRVFEHVNDPLRVKLMDFGIAKGQGDAALTATGKSVGTPRFMSPEQLFGGFIGPPSDVYSVGLMAYEMLTGRQSEHMRLLANGQRVALAPEEGVHPGICDLVNRMLEREPAARFADAGQALAALESVYDSARAVSTPASRPATAPAPVPVPPEGRHRRGARVTAIAAAVVAAGAAAWALWPESPAPVAGVVRRPPPVGIVSGGASTQPAKPTPVVPDAGRVADAPSIPAGCGAPAPFEGTGSMRGGSALSPRDWLVHVPKGYAPNVEHALVVLLHDDLSGPADILAWSRMAAAADEHQFIALAPAASQQIFVWQQAEDLDRVREAVDHTRGVLCIDPERVFVAGLAAGGGGAETLSCEEWVSGVALASYLLDGPTWRCAPARPVPTILFLPSNSGWLPVAGGSSCMGGAKRSFDEWEQLWIERNACQSSPAPVSLDGVRGEQCRQWTCAGAPLVSCRFEGGGAWPGGPRRTGDVAGCDGEPGDFAQTEAIWSFLSRVGRTP